MGGFGLPTFFLRDHRVVQRLFSPLCPHTRTRRLHTLSVCTIVLVRRSERGLLASFTRASSLLHSGNCFHCALNDNPQVPTSLIHRLWPSNLFVVLTADARVPLTTFLLNAQEPRKAEAPQLRDECRSYRILTHCRVSFY
jgi:hypothetical protein